MKLTWNNSDKKDKEENENEETSVEDTKSALLQHLENPMDSMRSMALYGDIHEEKASEIVGGLLALHHIGKSSEEVDPTHPSKAIEMFISTYGGCADDMFSIIDIMSVVKKDCAIKTIGLGKVMSAGVLVLAAGTKGQRYIGKNCRVMLHSVSAGHHGTLHNLENEIEEVRKLQDLYIENLITETNLTKKQIRAFLRRKSNVYLSAEEAIKYGIADKIYGEIEDGE
tara:strand:+ start:16414 stop:17091 length:678 start_codon:yes stop_codon:yes gene_type:complete